MELPSSVGEPSVMILLVGCVDDWFLFGSSSSQLQKAIAITIDKFKQFDKQTKHDKVA